MSVVRWKSNVKVLWTGTGTGDVISEGAANASFSEPGAGLDGLLVDYEITNIDSADTNGLPTEREVGRNLWSDGVGAISPDGTLTRTDGAPADRNSAGVIDGSNGTNRVNFTGGTKLVSITPVGETFGTSADADVGNATGNVRDVTGGTPDGTQFLRDDGAWASPSGTGGDAAPTQDISDATPYALADASRLHLNVQVRSHQASVDFEVAQAASAGSAWWVFFDHDTCTISVNGDVGSVNGVGGGSVQGVTGGWAVVSIKSNAGSAPVVEVKGDIIPATNSTGGAKTYDNDDHGLDWYVPSGTQTFGATADFIDGFFVNLWNRSGGDVTIDGLDADHTLPNNGVVTVKRLGDGSLVCNGSGGDTLLDAA